VTRSKKQVDNRFSGKWQNLIFFKTKSARRLAALTSAKKSIKKSFKKVYASKSWVARWHIFKPKKSIWVNFGGSATEDVGIFYDHFVYFVAIWYIIWLFGTYIFPRSGMLYQEKSGNPA
jgi:hypothetical protein